jgi:hypothetical protein
LKLYHFHFDNSPLVCKDMINEESSDFERFFTDS